MVTSYTQPQNSSKMVLSVLRISILCITGILLFVNMTHGQSVEMKPLVFQSYILSGDDVKAHFLVNPTTAMAGYEVKHAKADSVFGYSLWRQRFKFKSIIDRVNLRINPDDHRVMGTFSYKFNLRIDRWDEDNVMTDTLVSLIVEFNPDELVSFTDRSMIEFYGYHKIKPYIISVQQSAPDSSGWDPVNWNSFQPKMEMDAEIRLQFYQLSYTGSGYNYGTALGAVSHSETSSGDIQIAWSEYAYWPTLYELEWTFVDDYLAESSYRPASEIKYDFQHNATRIYTASSSYVIPNVYEHGYLMYRVRRIRPDSINYQGVYYGAWTGSAQSGLVSAATHKKHITASHEGDSLNWVYSLAFAEGARNKAVLNYLDGTFRSRQTVTRLSSQSGHLLVSDQIYNFAGRPAIQVLPGGVSGFRLRYVEGYSRLNSGTPYTAELFDGLNCVPTGIPGLDTNFGAGAYYSSQSPSGGYHRSFLPNADGFPFIQTEYTPDNTGRPLRVGGAGAAFRLGEKNTRYAYAQPFQAQLNMLFGSEIGLANYYRSNIVLDPNGQATIQIQNQAGKTVASMLAGESDPGNAIEPLAGSTASEWITEDLLQGGEQIMLASGSGWQFRKPFFVEKAGTYAFGYEIEVPPYSPECEEEPICTSCEYDFIMYLLDECQQDTLFYRKSVVKAASGQPVCDNVLFKPFDAEDNDMLAEVLDVGQYFLLKELTLSTANLESKAVNYVAEAEACLLTTEFFVMKSVDSTDFDGCAISGENDRCDKLKAAMLADVTPGGRYAPYKDSIHASTGVYFRYFPVNTSSLLAYDTGSGVGRLFQDISGISYPATTTLPNGTVVTPSMISTMSVEDFVNNFQPEWAEALLVTHPEYCRLQDCFSAASDGFYAMEDMLDSINTYEDAVASGFYAEGSAIATLIDIDPLYDNITPPSPTDFRIDLWTPYTNLDIDKAARLIAYCATFASGDILSSNLSHFDLCEDVVEGDYIKNNWLSDSKKDDFWSAFKTFYLEIRKDLTGTAYDPPAECAKITLYELDMLEPLFLTGSDVVTAGLPAAFQDLADNPSNPTVQGAGQTYVTNALAAAREAKCTAVIQQVITAFEGCVDFLTYQENVISDLESVCSTNGIITYSDLEDIINNYFSSGQYTPAWCNIHLVDLAWIFREEAYGRKYVTSAIGVYSTPVGMQNLLNQIDDSYPANNYSTKTISGATSLQDSVETWFSGTTAVVEYASIGSDMHRFDLYAGFPHGPHFRIVLQAISGSFSFSASSYTFSSIRPDTAMMGYLLSMGRAEEGKNFFLINIGSTVFRGWTMNFSLYDYPVEHQQFREGEKCLNCPLFAEAYNGFSGIYGEIIPFNSPHYGKVLTAYMNQHLNLLATETDYKNLVESCGLTRNYALFNRHCDATVTFNGGGFGEFEDNLLNYMDYNGIDLYPGLIIRREQFEDVTSYCISFENLPAAYYSIALELLEGIIGSAGAYDYSILPDNTEELILYVFSESETGCDGEITSTLGGYGINFVWEGYLAVDGVEDRYVRKYAINWDIQNSSEQMLEINNLLAYLLSGTECVDYGFRVFWGRPFHNPAVYTSENGFCSSAGPCIECEAVGAAVRGFIYSKTDYAQTSMEEMSSTAIKDHLVNESIVGSEVTVAYGPGDCMDCNGSVFVCEEISTDLTTLTYVLEEIAIKSDSVYTSYTPFFPGVNLTVWVSAFGGSFQEVIFNRNGDGSFWLQIRPKPGNRIINVQFFAPTFPGFSPENMSVMSSPGPRLVAGRGNSHLFEMPFYDVVRGTIIWLQGWTDLVVTNCCEIEYVTLCDKGHNNFSYIDTVNCERATYVNAVRNGVAMYDNYIEAVKDTFKMAWADHCVNNATEAMDLRFQDNQYQYTLYYYDLAGNLIRTVPPQGVLRIDADSSGYINSDRLSMTNGITPSHSMKTEYRYNAFNQPYEQTTPDGGTTRFWYDGAGQVVLSQTAEQYITSKFNYTLYDALGRPYETGLVTISSPSSITSNVMNQSLGWLASQLASLDKFEVVRQYYDKRLRQYAVFGGQEQRNLRSRVATVAYYHTYKSGTTEDSTDYAYATHYSYDISGNVAVVIQDYPELAAMNQQFKRIDYAFDLISGNVNVVSYQAGYADQFYHRYTYDGDNRITEVESSHDGMIWDKDARYYYYLHGPLARVELGQYKVQGVDYAYTLQGWMKAMNSAVRDSSHDIGQDAGTADPLLVARDAISFTLGYHSTDYEPVNLAVAKLEASKRQSGNLYNGNITHMVADIQGVGALARSYTYDQLNRLISADNFELMDSSGIYQWDNSGVLSYMTEYTYDKNGNITGLVRRGGGSNTMDNLTYTYNAGKNQLNKVTDAVTTSPYPDDLKHGQGNNNYTYYADGTLKTDGQAGQQYYWNTYGKLSSVKKPADHFVNFAYNAMGQRIKKSILADGDLNLEHHDYYVPDAQGNVLAVYRQDFEAPGTEGNIDNIMTEILNQTGYPGLEAILLQLSSNPSFMTAVLNKLSGTGYDVSLIGTQGPGFYFDADINTLKMVLLNASPTFLADLYAEDNGVMIAEALYYCAAEFFLEQIITGDGSYYNHMAGEICNNLPDGSNLYNEMISYFSTIYYSHCYSILSYCDIDIPCIIEHAGATEFISFLKSYDQGVDSVMKELFVLLLNNNPQVFDDLLNDKEFQRIALRQALAGCGKMADLKAFTVSWLSGNLTPVRTAVGDEYLLYLIYRDDPSVVIGELIQNTEYAIILSVLRDMHGFSATDLLQLIQQILGQSVYDNVLAAVSSSLEYAEKISLTEHYIYGSKRLGVRKAEQELYYNVLSYSSMMLEGMLEEDNLGAYTGSYDPECGCMDDDDNDDEEPEPEPDLPAGYAPGRLAQHRIGRKEYELTNHLGNVMATIADRRTGVKANPFDTLYAWYAADVKTAQDYYPFGMLMPGRHYTAGTAQNYRYGMNGQEKDDEIYGKGNSYSAEFWQYDARLGRRWNIDPVVKPHESPYAAFGNNPIWFIDPNGADTSFSNDKTRKEFVGTYNLVNNRINALSSRIDRKMDKWKEKGYEGNRYSRQIKRLNNQRADLYEIKNSFDQVIQSPVMHYYIGKSNTNNNSSGGGTSFNFSANRLEHDYFLGNDQSLIHETRHGAGYDRGEWSSYFDTEQNREIFLNYDYQDEYEGFRAASMFMRHIYGQSLLKIYGATDLRSIIEEKYSTHPDIIKRFNQYCEPGGCD